MLIGGLLLAGPVIRLEAGEPLNKVRRTIDAVLAVLDDQTLQPQERRSKLRQAVLQRFGFDEMAQRALGHHWHALTPQQQQEFEALFTDLLERSYINRIETYNLGTQSMRYISEDINKDYASVRTEIMSEHDLPVVVEYRLLYRDGA
jgi:phospholipid transport system substrate-binding protein